MVLQYLHVHCETCNLLYFLGFFSAYIVQLLLRLFSFLLESFVRNTELLVCNVKVSVKSFFLFPGVVLVGLQSLVQQLVVVL